MRGLRRYLELEGIVAGSETIPSGSTFCVDGYGWFYHVMNRCSRQLRRELGGHYKVLAEAIEENVNFYLRFGLKLVFFFDGPVTRMKGYTTNRRDRERRREWNNLRMCCEDHTYVTRTLPAPILFYHQAKSTLLRLSENNPSVEIIECEEEADHYITTYIHDYTREGTAPFFIYGNDSDYLLMRDCSYIEFGTCRRVHSSPLMLNAPVWRRSDICGILGINENQLINWAILNGNDYTSQYSLGRHLLVNDEAQRGALEECNVRNNQSRIALLLNFVRDQAPDFRVIANPDCEERESIELAIRFTHTFYQVMPIGDEFPIDDDDNEEEDDADAENREEESLLSRLFPPEEEQRVISWFEQTDLSTFASIGRCALAYYQSLLERDPFLTHEHLGALATMLDQLQTRRQIAQRNATGVGRNNGSFRNGLQAIPEERLSWEDMAAALKYQLTIDTLLDEMPSDMEREIEMEPQYLIDCVLYREILLSRRTV